MNIDPTPSVVELVKDNPNADSMWKRWFDNIRNILLPEDWHEVGATGEPAFGANWSNYGSPWNTAAFYKHLDRVYIRGNVKHAVGGVGTAIFTLPAGYWPETSYSFTQYAGTGPCRVDVSSVTGAVILNTLTASAAVYLFLDGISFRV
jgi:hypothetical protein